MNSCLIYLGELFFEISQGKPLNDPTKIAYENYSGSTLNQQGDVAACIKTLEMNFFELKLFFSGVTFYEGMCLKEVCSAQAMNSIKKEFAEFLSLAIQTTITPEQLNFNQYPVEKPSTDNYGFIIITLILAFILLLTLISFFMLVFKSKSKDINKTYLEQQDSQSQSNFVDKDQIQTKLINREEILNKKLEASLEKIEQQMKLKQNMNIKASPSPL
ncbi:hypothetical protein ABPG72_014467 [Tetrahymena utriculariae]